MVEQKRSTKKDDGKKYKPPAWVPRNEDGRNMLSEEGAREQSIYENSGEPIPKPRTDGEEVKNPNTEEVPIVILGNWIFRSRRSHKPYPYDTADKEFKEAIITAWKNPENKSYKQICKEVASKTREILDHTV
jgi:hypothetical protein